MLATVLDKNLRAIRLAIRHLFLLPCILRADFNRIRAGDESKKDAEVFIDLCLVLVRILAQHLCLLIIN
jgi:hypothetical protein